MLQWQTVHTVKVNFIRVDVNKAVGRNGSLYSMRVLRHDRGNSNYFRLPNDVQDLEEAIAQANDWARKDNNGEA